MTADIAAVRPDDAAVLVMLARAFHAEEARTLDAAGEAALVAIAQGEKLARAVLTEHLDDRPGTPTRVGGPSGSPVTCMIPLSAWMMMSMAFNSG